LRIEQVLTQQSAKRVFLVTDQTLQRAGVVGHVTSVIEKTSAELLVFDECEIEPSTASVDIAAKATREFAPDSFVAVGGGSIMDLAKACRATISCDCDPTELFGFDNVSAVPTTKLICMPTTAGTGSEVSHSAVIRDSTSGKKGTILSQNIRPDIAIVDPYLTVNCPQKVTAESGLSALTHAIEAYLTTNFYAFEEPTDVGLAYEGNNPLGDILAERAIQLIGKNLQRAYEEPEDLAARSGMALGSNLAGSAFSNCGGGLCQALASPIAVVDGVSHGTANGLVLPEVMRSLKEHRLPRLAKIARLLTSESSDASDDEAADEAIHFVEQLRAAMDLPETLLDVGIGEEQLDEIVETTFESTRLMELTPGSPSEADVRGILKACLNNIA